MTKTTYRDKNVLRLKYFYKLFVKRKRLFPSSYFLFPTYTRKKTLPVEWPLFKNIVSTYLDVYFNEFYFDDTPKYFILSGKLQKGRGARNVINSKRGIFKESNSIGWIWFLRPSISFMSNVRLIKLKGKTSRVNKLDKKYCENKDVNVLIPVRELMTKLIEQNKLIKND